MVAVVALDPDRRSELVYAEHSVAVGEVLDGCTLAVADRAGGVIS
ncbi:MULTISPECIES: hypothetical protein [unclassified Arthrobacter]|nr:MULTISPECIES: hypothetical protein [unclassified Arthrobacter]